jgi:hypothetical protein
MAVAAMFAVPQSSDAGLFGRFGRGDCCCQRVSHCHSHNRGGCYGGGYRDCGGYHRSVSYRHDCGGYSRAYRPAVHRHYDCGGYYRGGRDCGGW